MWRALVVLLLGCASAPPPPVEEEPEPPRTKIVFTGDPVKALTVVRSNAKEGGCAIVERSSGTLIKCPDADVWFVSDPNGMEITCTGVNCSKRTRALMQTK